MILEQLASILFVWIFGHFYHLPTLEHANSSVSSAPKFFANSLKFFTCRYLQNKNNNICYVVMTLHFLFQMAGVWLIYYHLLLFINIYEEKQDLIPSQLAASAGIFSEQDI